MNIEIGCEFVLNHFIIVLLTWSNKTGEDTMNYKSTSHTFLLFQNVYWNWKKAWMDGKWGASDKICVFWFHFFRELLKLYQPGSWERVFQKFKKKVVSTFFKNCSAPCEYAQHYCYFHQLIVCIVCLGLDRIFLMSFLLLPWQSKVVSVFLSLRAFSEHRWDWNWVIRSSRLSCR